MGRNQKVDIKMLKHINDLYDNGWTIKRISEETGYGHSCIGNYIWNPRPRGPMQKEM